MAKSWKRESQTIILITKLIRHAQVCKGRFRNLETVGCRSSNENTTVLKFDNLEKFTDLKTFLKERGV